MNNSDISYLMNMLNNIDKNELAKGIKYINQIISHDAKQKIIQALNLKNNTENQ